LVAAECRVGEFRPPGSCVRRAQPRLRLRDVGEGQLLCFSTDRNRLTEEHSKWPVSTGQHAPALSMEPIASNAKSSSEDLS
jgi:hypothetical protein